MPIHHIVLLKYKEGTSASDKEAVRKRLFELKDLISHISDLKKGTALPNPMAQGFDDGVIMVFENEEALEKYRPHEAHRSYQAWTAQFVADKIIFDIVE